MLDSEPCNAHVPEQLMMAEAKQDRALQETADGNALAGTTLAASAQQKGAPWELEQAISVLASPTLPLMGAAAPGVESADDDGLWDYNGIDIGELAWGPPLQLAAHHVLFRDKIAFVIGVWACWSMAFWLGHSPATLYKLYSVGTVALLAVRYFVYRSRRWHYFLLDFCYFANVLILAYCWILPANQSLAKVCFAFATGPLTLSIPAFRNSLVFHSMDRVTSLYLHAAPALVVWTIRWHAGDESGHFAGSMGRLSRGPLGFAELVLLPLLPYAVWSSIYSLIIFVFCAERIRRRGYATLFGYTTNTARAGAFAAIARRVPASWHTPVYLALHCAFCVVGFAVAALAWHRKWAHTALLVYVGIVAVWHGAGHYSATFGVHKKQAMSRAG